MNSKMMSGLVGLFVVGIITMMIALVMFIGDQGFSGKKYKRYELLYDTSIKGLSVGAPVTLRGVKIGEVVTVKTKMYQQPQQILNSVVVDIYSETIVQESAPGNTSRNDELIDQLLARGLGAKLQVQSILTGMLYIEVDLFGDDPVSQSVNTEHPQIPTLPNNLEALTKELEGVSLASMANNLQSILNNLSALSGDGELQSVAGNLNAALNNVEKMSSVMGASVTAMQKDFSVLARDLDKLVVQLDKQLPAATRQIDATLGQLQNTMAQLDNTLVEVSDTVASDSPLVYQLEQSSRDISKASRAIEDLASLLENQPDSILFGRKGVTR